MSKNYTSVLRKRISKFSKTSKIATSKNKNTSITQRAKAYALALKREEEQMKRERAELIQYANDNAQLTADKINAILKGPKCIKRQMSIPKSQGNTSTCIQHSVGRTIANESFSNLTAIQKHKILEIIITYLTVPAPMIFDGSLIPEFLNILQSKLGSNLQIVEGDYAIGNLPTKQSIYDLFNQYIEECRTTATVTRCSSPLWQGDHDCYTFISYFVCYVLIPDTFNEDNMYTLGRLGYKNFERTRENTDAELIAAQDDIGLVVESKPIRYNKDGSYEAYRNKKWEPATGHALVIKGCSVDSNNRVTHLLVRNSWDDWDNPNLGGSWVPYKFFFGYTYGIIRIVNQPTLGGRIRKSLRKRHNTKRNKTQHYKK